MFSSQDLDEIDFQSIAREVKEFGEWNHVLVIWIDVLDKTPFLGGQWGLQSWALLSSSVSVISL